MPGGRFLSRPGIIRGAQKHETVTKDRRRRIRLDARPHGVVLLAPLVKALVLAAAGGILLALGWPASAFAVVPLALGAVIAVRAAWRWERTRLVVTDDEVSVVAGTLRRRSATVPLVRLGPVEVEQGVVGRVLGYGTLVAGDLEVPYVARPREVARLLR
jgi:membrane protein YdbS with pleckstrin-like domain